MRRRALLASLATASAGCLGTVPPSSQTTQSPQSDADGTYEVTDLSVSTETDRPSVKYVLESTKVYSEDGVEREETRTGEEQVVTDVSDLDDPAIRDAVRTAVVEGEWQSNDLPEGLADTLEQVDFFTGFPGRDTATHIGLTLHRLDPDAPPAIEFDASVVDSTVADEDPGVLEFALTNAGSTTRQASSGTVPPFGMLFADSVGSGAKFLLWRPYEEEGCINFTDDGWSRCDIGMVTELAPNETISREYEILPEATTRQPKLTVPPGPGTYRVSDSLGHSVGAGAPASKLSFEVTFDLESQ